MNKIHATNHKYSAKYIFNCFIMQQMKDRVAIREDSHPVSFHYNNRYRKILSYLVILTR